MNKSLPNSVCIVALAVFLQRAEAAPAAVSTDQAPLNLVIDQVKAALDEYQRNLGEGSDALPPLSSAEFDFKATTAVTSGGTITFLIFKIGTTHENDVTNDITYTYSVPKPPAKTGLTSNRKPPSLKDALAQAIQSAAQAVKTSGSIGNLKFSKLTVNLQYGVKWDGNAGVSVPLTLVTPSVNGDFNKNTIQSVKLVFGE